MSTRKEFIAAAATAPLLAAAPSSPPAATPSPAPAATPKKRQISQAARALAARMRSFDASLSDKELEQIAGGIDDNLKLGDRVNPHGTAIKNWDEPASEFEVPA